MRKIYLRKYIMSSVLTFGLITMIAPATAFASAEEKESSRVTASCIPTRMEPGSKIIFIDKGHFEIKQGAMTKSKTTSEVSITDRSSEELELDASSLSTGIKEEYPTPETGMQIQYGSDGLVSDIQFPDESSKEKVEIASAVSEIETRTSGKVKIASWGSSNNVLYKEGNTITGYGRATTFSDKIGQRDHKLIKGDVATKLKYDNCAYGRAVKVTARLKGSKKTKTVSMKKRDVGGMPNAVIDIWKTGVSNWNYKYSSSLTLPGRTKIQHAK